MKTFLKTLIICLCPFTITAQQLEFTQHLVAGSFTKGADVIAVDLDKDGDMDILGAACMSSSIAWYENNGSQQFIKHSLPNLYNHPECVVFDYQRNRYLTFISPKTHSQKYLFTIFLGTGLPN